MKTVVFFIILLLVLLFGLSLLSPPAGPRSRIILPQPAIDPAVAIDPVVFTNAGVELRLVGEWRLLLDSVLIPTNLPAPCLPMLQGAGTNRNSFIEILRTSHVVDLPAEVKALKEVIQAEPAVSKDSLDIDEFKTVNGAVGRRLSYEFKSQGKQSDRRIRVACYVFVNKRGKGVFVNQITFGDSSADLAEQTVKTLVLRKASDIPR